MLYKFKHLYLRPSAEVVSICSREGEHMSICCVISMRVIKTGIMNLTTNQFFPIYLGLLVSRNRECSIACATLL